MKMEKAGGTIWRKVWLRKIGEDGVSLFSSRMIQGIIVGHHDRTGAVSSDIKNRVVRGKKFVAHLHRCAHLTEHENFSRTLAEGSRAQVAVSV